MKVSKQRKLGAILSYVSIVASTVVQLLYTPFLVSKLGQSEYGLYSLVASIIGYLTILDLGFGNAIVVHTSKYRATGETKKEQVLHGMFKVLYFCIGVVAMIIGVIVALNSESLFGNTMSTEDVEKMRIMMLILSFNLFMTFSFSIYNSIITASESFVFQKILAIIDTVAKPLLMIPVLFMGYKSVALCIVITVVNVATLLTNYFYCKKQLKVSVKYSGFDKKLLKVVFGYSFFIFLTQVVDQVNWRADQFILGMVSGTIAVSVYAAASQINMMFVNLSTAISGVLLPKISRMVASKVSSKSLTDEMVKVGRLQFYIVFLAVSGFVLVGRQFMSAWLGDGFDDSYVIALLLMVPAVVPLIQNTGIAILQAMNRYQFKSVVTFVMALFNIVLSIFLAKNYGAIGAAAGTTIAIVVCNIIIMNVYYMKVIQINVIKFWKEIIVMLVKSLLPFGIVFSLIRFTNFGGWFAVITYGAVYVIMYALMAYFVVMNKYERNLINTVLNKISRKRSK